MEEEKRKRSEKESDEDQEKSTVKKKKKKIIAKKAATEETTEEEVEEFFEILRRMKVAVKYFGEGWREAVETDAMTTASMVIDRKTDNNNNENNKEKVRMRGSGGMVEGGINRVLDLNTVPEVESMNVNGKG